MDLKRKKERKMMNVCMFEHIFIYFVNKVIISINHE